MKTFPAGTKPEDTRKIEVEIELEQSVEDVWPYLSTSDGLSSWYVEAKFAEEKAGVPCELTFGPGMVVPAFVHAYDDHQRVRLGPPPDIDSPRVEEYSVRAKEGGGSIVRIVNWGFGEGAEWDAEYDAVKKGWGAFLQVLKAVLTNFPGQTRTGRALQFSMGSDAEGAWKKLKEGLAIQGAIEVGADVLAKTQVGSPISGQIDEVGELSLGLIAKGENGGVLLRASVERQGPVGMIGLAILFFGDRGKEADAMNANWAGFFQEHFPPPAM